MTPDESGRQPADTPLLSRIPPQPRVRFAPSVDPKLRVWMTRTARCHAHLSGVTRAYTNPAKAGGASRLGEEFAQRIADGDRSLLYDALGYCRDEIDALRDEIARVMESCPPTRHLPGSREKVDLMMRRLEQGYSLFVPGDAQVSLD